MISATKRWFQRNRKGLAIGAGVIGAGYLAGQYVLGKISEASERMGSDRIAREKYVISSLMKELGPCCDVLVCSEVVADEPCPDLAYGDASNRTKPTVPTLS